MWKSIRQELTVQRNLFGYSLGMTLASWIVGVAIMTVVQAIGKETTDQYFCLGSVLALMVGEIVNVILGVMVIYQGFDDAVHMGKTRKRFLPSVTLVIFLAVLLSLAATAILIHGEYALYHAWFPNLVRKPGPEGYLTPPWLVCCAAAITGLCCLFGGIVKANRKVGGVASLIVWVTLCWSIGGIGGVDEGEGAFFGMFSYLGYAVSVWFGSLAVPVRLGLLMALGLAGFGLMYKLLIGRASD